MSEPTTTIYLLRRDNPDRPPQVGDGVTILGTATIGRRQERLREARAAYEATRWGARLVVGIAREVTPPRTIAEAKAEWIARRTDARDAYYTALDALDPHPGQGHIWEQAICEPRGRCALCGELDTTDHDDDLTYDDEGDEW